MVAVTQVVKSCSRALSRYLGMDSLLTRRLKNKNVFILPKLFGRDCLFQGYQHFSLDLRSWADLIYSLITCYVAQSRAEWVQYPAALPTQTSRAFLQLAPNIKLVYVPKLSLDGHSESVRQGISDFLAVLSLSLSPPLAAYICVAAAGARRCWWSLASLKTFLISNVGVKIDSCDEIQRPQPGTKTHTVKMIPREPAGKNRPRLRDGNSVMCS